jgi:NADPH:quinone reductase-like Zn-dependent oxidoreductase
MFAVLYERYGDPDVLVAGAAAEPHPGPGEVRVAVRATSVNPFDCKTRAGYLAQMVPVQFPAIPGVDAAGVIDEIGAGVQGFSVGDEVFGLGAATSAEYALLDVFAHKPASLSFEQAAALPLAAETAVRGLDLLAVGPGTTLLIEGAAGGVGGMAIQFAVARGATVIGTASENNHQYLASLGAIPTTYGLGLADRVAALAPGGVDAVLDTAGQGSVPDLIALVPRPAQVVSIADFGATALGARFADGSEGRAVYALAQAAEAHQQGTLVITIQQILPLADLATGHRLSETGHVRGKLVISVP